MSLRKISDPRKNGIIGESLKSIGPLQTD